MNQEVHKLTSLLVQLEDAIHEWQFDNYGNRPSHILIHPTDYVKLMISARESMGFAINSNIAKLRGCVIINSPIIEEGRFTLVTDKPSKKY